LILSSDGTTVLQTSVVRNPYLFSGRRLDVESELFYYRARYFSPALGRFISRDPLGYFVDASLYRYVLSSPLRYLDPSGLGQHHWFPQAKELLDLLGQVCGDFFESEETTAKKFADSFTTELGPWVTGSPHHDAHHGDPEGGHYNDQVRDIYEQNDGDCCSVLKGVKDLISKTFTRVWKNSNNVPPGWQGPVPFPPLHPFHKPSDPLTNDLLDKMIDRACRPPVPCPEPEPEPVRVPVLVPQPEKVCFWTPVIVGAGAAARVAWRWSCTLGTAMGDAATTILIPPMWIPDPNDGT